MAKIHKPKKVKSRINVTITTDASFSHIHDYGTYAFDIVCNNFRIRKSGLLSVAPGSSAKAEMMAIANALHILYINKDKLELIDNLIINTDCIPAIKYFERPKHADVKMAVKILNKVKAYFNVRNLEFRHVKAHIHESTRKAKHHVNEWCDMECKRIYREEFVRRTIIIEDKEYNGVSIEL